jgi:Uma2 family endonuclease
MSAIIPKPTIRTVRRTFPVANEIYYPDSDGEPVANNTLHYELIASTKAGLELAYQDRDDIFVAADLFWYPVEGNPKIAVAPDVMVAFDRPPGPRKSYKQWEEAKTPFHVVFEFLSDANTPSEMAKKAMFFDRYGVEEYYLYDMERGTLQVFTRQDNKLQEIATPTEGWISPRLGIRFDVEWSTGKRGKGIPELALYHTNGARFTTYLELANERNEIQAERDEFKSERDELQAQLEAEREQVRLLREQMQKLQS